MVPRRGVARRLALVWAALLCDALPCAGSGASPALLRFMQGGRGKKSGAEAEEQQPPPAPERAQEEERPCSLIKLDARELSAARFRREFQGREPVLLTHAADGWGARRSWSSRRDAISAHGDLPLPLQHPNLLAEKGSFAPTMATVPLRDFLAQNLTDGIGDQPFFRNRWHALTDAVLAETDYSALPTRTIRQHHILSLGGEGTGVGLHSHTENWLAQVAGRKAWALTKTIGPHWRERRRHGCEWARTAQQPGSGFEHCTVGEGEAIYIPTAYYHATCNLDPLTLAIGGQGDIGDVQGRPQLMTAILDDDQAELTRLLQLPPPKRAPLLAARTQSGYGAVHVAIMHNRVAALKLLHAAGVDLAAPLRCHPEVCNMLGTSPWFEQPSAAPEGWVLATGATAPEAQQEPPGIPVLYLAVRYGVIDVLQYLTAAGVSGLNVGTEMPVPLAKARRKVKPGQALPPMALRTGVINVAHAACAYGELAILRWALAADPSIVSLVDQSGAIPLHYCARQADARLLEVLLKSGGALSADERRMQLLARDGEGKTAETIAEEKLTPLRTGSLRERRAAAERGGPGWLAAAAVVREATKELLGRTEL